MSNAVVVSKIFPCNVFADLPPVFSNGSLTIYQQASILGVLSRIYVLLVLMALLQTH